MSSRPLLETTLQDPQDECAELRKRVSKLERDIQVLRENCIAMSRGAVEELLKRMFSPLHRATSTLVGDAPVPTATDGGAILWGSRIAKAGEREGRILQVLLDGGGQMTLSQIKQSARTYGDTSVLLNKLQAKNWVEKLGHGTWGLKS